jgi:hypothetical protein
MSVVAAKELFPYLRIHPKRPFEMVRTLSHSDTRPQNSNETKPSSADSDSDWWISANISGLGN